MICKNCGKDFYSVFLKTCPFCGYYNLEEKKNDEYDPYDWDNPDNCSDDEYMDDDDYDDFDN